MNILLNNKCFINFLYFHSEIFIPIAFYLTFSNIFQYITRYLNFYDKYISYTLIYQYILIIYKVNNRMDLHHLYLSTEEIYIFLIFIDILH